jgi:hypothetical protein
VTGHDDPNGRRCRILVGPLVDKDNNNAQALNARNLLARFSDPHLDWISPHYGVPDERVSARQCVTLQRLWHWRFWMISKMLFYQKRADIMFYPGFYWFDEWGWRLRELMGRRVPVIAILESLVGDEARERLLSEHAGHPVYCSRAEPAIRARVDRLYARADHIVAISPFLAKMGRLLYGDKCSVIPLGIDAKLFYPNDQRDNARPFTVIGAGSISKHKRASLFVELADAFPDIQFLWYGDGYGRAALVHAAQARSRRNLHFAGAVSPPMLADAFRAADLFVFPSIAEGVPKVVQEACACGLPAILMGYYESPSVRDGVNGYVVWDDDQLFRRVGELSHDRGLSRKMGIQSAGMAAGWNWDQVALEWESKIRQWVPSNR